MCGPQSLGCLVYTCVCVCSTPPWSFGVCVCVRVCVCSTPPWLFCVRVCVCVPHRLGCWCVRVCTCVCVPHHLGCLVCACVYVLCTAHGKYSHNLLQDLGSTHQSISFNSPEHLIQLMSGSTHQSISFNSPEHLIQLTRASHSTHVRRFLELRCVSTGRVYDLKRIMPWLWIYL